MEFGTLLLALMLAGVIVFLIRFRDWRFFKKPAHYQRYLTGLNFLLNEQPDKAVDIFIQLFEVNSDTVETHLAMGNLFRKRGEVDKAIRLHQNLVTQTHLSKKIRVEALSALGEDYLKAGVLDRAERVFHEVVALAPETRTAFERLLEIYQQEKSWHEAIAIAEKLAPLSSKTNEYKKIIAQYNCEIADDYLKSNDFENTVLFLKRARKSDEKCLRAYLVSIKMHLFLLEGDAALPHLKEIANIQPSFLFYCVHELLNLPYNVEIESSLHRCLAYCVDHMSPEALLLLLNIYPHIRLTHEALKRLQHYIYQTPALLSLTVLFQLMESSSLTSEDERYIRHTLLNVGREGSNYRCEHCGFSSKRFYWLCPSCKQWEEMRPHFIGVS